MRRVYFNEYNVRMGRMCYLPLVSGLLQAYAQTDQRIRDSFTFERPIFALDSFDNVMAQYRHEPDVAAFSVSMWNEQLSLRVAAEVKRRWPGSMVVFGGPSVPHQRGAYIAAHPFIDVCVTAEGEEPFHDILIARLGDGDYSKINDPRPFKRELDEYPSPYLEGLYDDLLSLRGDNLDWQAIIETNRGCPFACTFCYWGRGGLSRKYRYHDMDRVRAEIDWCGRNRIAYVFNADSNFGMHKRDREIADFIVSTKERYGYPDKFRTCFGKNTNDAIFEIGSLLHRNRLEKGITLARQSNDAATLANIKRSNIKMSTYEDLQRRFNAENIPIYSELILGLPGETVESWVAGIDAMLDAGLKNQLFTYLCQVLPNTEMADPEYRERHGIRTRFVQLNEIHGSVRDKSWVAEYEELVVETASMAHRDWRRMVKLSWLVMSLHSMKLGCFLLDDLRRRGIKAGRFCLWLLENAAGTFIGEEIGRYDLMIDSLMLGRGRGTILPEYGSIYWDAEEATFLRASQDWDTFYGHLRALAERFTGTDLSRVIAYQRSRMPSPRHFGGNLERFARETILWGRKSGTMLLPETAQAA